MYDERYQDLIAFSIFPNIKKFVLKSNNFKLEKFLRIYILYFTLLYLYHLLYFRDTYGDDINHSERKNNWTFISQYYWYEAEVPITMNNGGDKYNITQNTDNNIYTNKHDKVVMSGKSRFTKKITYLLKKYQSFLHNEFLWAKNSIASKWNSN